MKKLASQVKGEIQISHPVLNKQTLTLGVSRAAKLRFQSFRVVTHSNIDNFILKSVLCCSLSSSPSPPLPSPSPILMCARWCLQ